MNEPVFRKGHRFIPFSAPSRYVDRMVSTSLPATSHADRLAKWSLITLAGIPVGILFSTFWAVWVDTSPTLSSEDRIRGWETVWRELPASLLLFAVCATGLVLAVRAGRQGATAAAFRAIWFHGAALFFVLLVVLNGSAENIMTTRPATVKWLMFPAQLLIAGLAVWGSRLLVSRRRNHPIFW